MEEKEVPYEHIVKGYEVSPGRYVTLTEEELEAADPKGTRTHLGAVHVGFFAGASLVYAGRAGSGLDDENLRALAAALGVRATDQCPFTGGAPPVGREHHWVRPELVCEVRFTEWTADGLLRHPVYLGLHSDRRPEDVGRELTPRS